MKMKCHITGIRANVISITGTCACACLVPVSYNFCQLRDFFVGYGNLDYIIIENQFPFQFQIKLENETDFRVAVNFLRFFAFDLILPQILFNYSAHVRNDLSNNGL